MEISETRSLEKYQPVVDSTTLVSYLEGIIPYDQPNLRFARYLNLATFKPFLVELYKSTQSTYVYSDEERESMMVQWQADLPENPGTSAIQQRFNAKFDAFVNQTAAAERSRVIYTDFDQSYFAATEIAHGDFGTSSISTVDVFEQGFVPLLEVHTHPHNRLPSPVDYYRLLLDVFDKPDRFVRGMIILCPNIQVLGLATPSSILMDHDDLDRLNGQYKSTEADKNRMQQLQRRYIAIEEYFMDHIVSTHKENLEHIIEMEKEYKRGKLSREELEELAKKAEASSVTSVEDLAKRVGKVERRAGAQLFGFEELTTNQRLLGFAREAGIKLYSATDFEHFTEFTA